MIKKFIIIIILISLINNIYSKNHIKVFFNAPPKSNNIDKEFIKLIDNAQKTVYANFFQINNLNIVSAFIRASERLGSQNVKIITDDYYYNKKGYKKIYKALENANIKIINDKIGKNRGNGFSHNKYCIVDHRYVWTGSYNITNNGTFKNSNNAVLIDSPDLAIKYENDFFEMYEEKRFSKLKKNYIEPTCIVDNNEVSVYFSPHQHVKQQIIREIKKAKKYIYFCIFSFTDKDIMNAMIKKAKNGIKIYGVFDQLQIGSKFSASHFMNYENIKIKYDNNKKGLLHHKFIVIDPNEEQNCVITGSFNFTKNANTINDENIIIFHDNSFIAKQYLKEFKRNYKYKNIIKETETIKQLAMNDNKIKNEFEKFPINQEGDINSNYTDYLNLKKKRLKRLISKENENEYLLRKKLEEQRRQKELERKNTIYYNSRSYSLIKRYIDLEHNVWFE